MSEILSLEERIERIEAIEQIKRLKAKWWFACDMRSLEDMRDCYYADDLLIDFGFIGQFTDIDEFLGTFKELACHPTHIDMHHGTCPEIEITGPDSARGRWRMRFQLLETKQNMVQLMHGYYDDEYVKVDGEWKMKVSRYTIMSNLLMQAESGPLNVLQIGAAPGLVTEESADGQ